MKRNGKLIVLLSLFVFGLPLLASPEGAKFVRFGEPGEERPGIIDSDGNIRDLSAHIPDLSPSTLSEIPRLRGIDLATLPVAQGSPRLGVPIADIGKIVAIGFNYRDHAAEMTQELPPEPLIFMKATSALNGPHDDVVAPRGHTQLDYEAELVVVIGKKASYVSEAEALDFVAGFSAGHDVSERAFQRNRGGQFVKGKSADSFAPLGPWLVTPDGVTDVQDLDVWSRVNGEDRQRSNTKHMIFGVAHIISYVSQFMTLNPGDVIFTGTPSGVGAGMEPPRFLKPGDVVEIGVESLGEQRQTVVTSQ